MFTLNLNNDIIERLHTIYNHPHHDNEEEIQLAEDIAKILHVQENK